MARVLICETLIKPQLVPVASSQGDGTYYTVIASTLFNDPVCECKGFEFRGTCKHIEMVEEARCHYHRVPTEEEDKGTASKAVRGKCPECQSKLLIYQLDPEDY